MKLNYTCLIGYMMPKFLCPLIITLSKGIMLIFLFFVFMINLPVAAQINHRPSIDESTIGNWPVTVGAAKISNNGRYVSYQVCPTLADLYFKPWVGYIKDITGKWSYKIDSVRENKISFSHDSRYVIYMLSNSSLLIKKLGTEMRPMRVKDVKAFESINCKGNEFVLGELIKNRGITIIHIGSQSTVTLPTVVKYNLSIGNDQIVSLCKKESGFSLEIYDLLKNKTESIFNSQYPLENLVSDESKMLYSFSNNGKVFVFNRYTNRIKELNLDIPKNKDSLSFASVKRFEANGKFLLLNYTKQLGVANADVNPVKIFSYQDSRFFSHRMYVDRLPENYSFIYDLQDKKLTRIEDIDESVSEFSKDGRFAIISKSRGDNLESYWNKLAETEDFLMNISTNIKRKLYGTFVSFSPDGEFMLLRDRITNDILSEDLSSGKLVNLTKSFTERDTIGEEPTSKTTVPVRFVGWLKSANSAIFYDKYDIWNIDPRGINTAKNLTLTQGRHSKTVFRFIDVKDIDSLCLGDEVVITAFNERSKQNGFYRLKIGNSKLPEKLLFTSNYYWAAETKAPYNAGKPAKAYNSNVWLVQKQDVEHSPNWFWTKDFKTLHAVSDIYPERNHNWMTSELIEFTTHNGVRTQAILYKPQDFDPKKKYPVLFNYYQTGESDKLHHYRSPRYLDMYFFNAPMMIAQGYLICLTDIHQKNVGEPAKDVVDALEGAADELAKRDYVDSKHFGAAGGSFGGYTTNCLAALSNKFSALVPISGVSNFFSMYANDPGLAVEEIENRQFSMGVSLASNPQLYLKNSPIAYAKSVKTPLLIVNTLKDYNVNVQQGNEWFETLRREGKLAWMLQYQEVGHGITSLKNQQDLYLRMSQFFGHYLQGKPAPTWMTNGVTINETGVKTGFEYDFNTATPKPSRLIK